MLTHKECRGKVILDFMYKGERFIDLSCLVCGKRWHLPNKNPLARYLMDKNG